LPAPQLLVSAFAIERSEVNNTKMQYGMTLPSWDGLEVRRLQ